MYAIRRLDHSRTYTLDDIVAISLLRREVATKIERQLISISSCFGQQTIIKLIKILTMLLPRNGTLCHVTVIQPMK